MDDQYFTCLRTYMGHMRHVILLALNIRDVFLLSTVLNPPCQLAAVPFLSSTICTQDKKIVTSGR
jgi:hypothetical protein